MSDYIPEGAKVAFTGYHNKDSLTMGDEGKVLLANGQAIHVLMTTGARKDSTVLVHEDDLSVLSVSRTSIEDSLYDGSLDSEASLTTVAVRNVYDRNGEQGLIKALANSGELPSFENQAEQVITQLASVVRNHPIVRSVLANLEEDEGDGFVNKLAISAIDDVLGG